MRKKLKSKVWYHIGVNIFVMLILIFFIMSGIASILFRYELISISKPTPMIPVIILLIICTVITSSLTLIIGYRVLGPIKEMIQAIKVVAKGDFSIHLDTQTPIKEFQEMNLQFNKMVKELDGIETLRNDFIVNVSHEFKTPIAAIEGYATLLQDKTLSEEEHDEYTQMILDSASQLSSLSNNILKLSKLESHEISPEKSDYSLDEQLRMAILQLESRWTNKKIDIDMDLPATTYYGNEELLLQVWLNIYSNAVKFTPENGTIYTRLRKTDKEVIVSISDTGIGMSEEVKTHIFDKFYQGEKDRSSEGNGLGLTLVKRIVDLCEGTIAVQSRPGEGTSFDISLPVTHKGYP